MTTDTTHILPGEHLHALRGRIAGDVFLPGDDGWDAARSAWQVLVEQQPAAVVVPHGAADVAATVRAARRLGLRVAPQSTGHAAGTVSAVSESILLRTDRLDSIEIDAVNRCALVGAGAVLSDVAVAAAAHGLAVVAGMAPSVGAVGFSLGGGLGWFSRSHGLAANSIRRIEAVDAHGRVVHADAERNPDLFWAARGGVAPVVVTALELQLYPISKLVAGALLWPLERAADIAHAWREWIGGVPDTVTSLARVLRYPPLPQLPEPLRGRAFVAVEVAIQEGEDAAGALLAPLRELTPAMDTVRTMSPAELSSVHGDPEQPTPAHGEALVVAEITAAAVEALLQVALAESSAPLLSIELRHLGGMAAPGRMDGGAVAAVSGEGVMYAVGIVAAPDALPQVQRAAREVVTALAPFAAPTRVKNFTETPAPAAELYGAATARLREVVGVWDPERVICTGHPLD